MPRRRNKNLASQRKLTEKQKSEVKRIASNQIKKSYPIQMTDYSISGSIGTSLSPFGMTDTLLNTILPNSNATYDLPLYQLPGENYRRLKIMITGLNVNLAIRGGTGTAILPADLYNNVRMRLIWSDLQQSDVYTTLAPSDVHAPLDNRNVSRVYFDKLFYLPTIAFDPSGYAIPTQRFYRKFFKINRMLEAYTTVDSGTSTDWDTKTGKLMLLVYSDSSVTPHPTITGHCQLFYKYVQ